MYPIKSNVLPVLSLPTSGIYYLLSAAAGTWLGFNLIFPVYMALIAWFSFLFFRRSAPDVLALVAGLVMGFNPLTYALVAEGAIALLTFFLIPLWLLLWEDFIAVPRPVRMAGLVVGLYLIVLGSLQYWNLILSLLVPYAIFRGRQAVQRSPVLDFSLYGVLGFAALFAMYPASGYLWSTYQMYYKPLAVWQGMAPDGGVWQVFAGVILLLVIAAAVRTRHEKSHLIWHGLAGLHLILFLQPRLAPLTLIGAVLQVPHNPQLSQNAVFGLALLFCALMIMLRGTAELPNSWQFAGAGLAVGLSLIGWINPLPVTQFPQYEFYESIQAEPENYAVLDFPIGADSLDKDITYGLANRAGLTQVYVPVHHKRTIGGLVNDLSIADLQAYETSAVMRLLTTQDPQVIEPDLYDLVGNLQYEFLTWRVGYIVFHQPDSVAAETVRAWLRWTGTFCRAGEEATLEYWRANWHPGGCPSAREITMDSAEAALAVEPFKTQWHMAPNNTMAAESTAHLIMWVIRPATDFRLTIRAAGGAAVDQPVTVAVNGQMIGEIRLTSEFADYELTVPRLAIGENGLVEIRLDQAANTTYAAFRLEPIF